MVWRQHICREFPRSIRFLVEVKTERPPIDTYDIGVYNRNRFSESEAQGRVCCVLADMGQRSEFLCIVRYTFTLHFARHLHESPASLVL